MNVTQSMLRHAFALVVFTLPLAAESLSVTTTVHNQQQGEPVQVQLRAKRVDGSATPIERTISVPGTEILDVPAGNWDVSLQSPLFWAAPIVASTGRPAALELWPAGTLHGAIKAEGKGAGIRELRVAFDPAPESEVGQPAGGSVCSVDKDQWRCLVPTGTHDLRFLSAGFAAEFRWKQHVREGKKTNVGALVFRRGASLIGFVQPVRGVKAEMKNVVIEARPRSVSGQARRSYNATPNARGLFQIAGLTAGDYLVHAATKGLRSEDRIVSILEDRNAELRSALILDTPKKIFLMITSSASSREAPWHLRLYRHTERAQLEDVLSATADAEGHWSGEVHVPGEYVLQLGRADESIWKSANFIVDAADVFLNVAIPVAKVIGTVKIGDRPLAGARLVFGSTRGLIGELALDTDDDGAFSGEMPVQDEIGKKWQIEIRSDRPQVARNGEYEPTRGESDELRFDIVLPRTVMSGRVVNEDKTVAAHALVTLQAEGVFEQTITGEDGVFEIVGFEPGAYRIQADAFQRTSDVLEIAATSGEAAPIELVLRSDVIVRGRIRSRAASGVEAELTALEREVRSAFVATATTDSQGLFELRLAPRTRFFDLVVQSPGFAVAVGRVEVRDEKLLTITVDQIGGGLALEIPADGDAILRHDGGEYPARWLAKHVGGSIEPGDGWSVARLANVEPGEYFLCANGQCRSGIVAPHSNLTLSLR